MLKEGELKIFDWETWENSDILAIHKKVKDLLEAGKRDLLSVGDKDLSFFHVFKKGDEFTGELNKIVSPLHTFELMHQDDEIRETSRKELLAIGQTLNKFSYDEEIYQTTKTYFEGNYKKEKINLSPEENKIVIDTMKAYKRMGLHLNKESKKKLIKIGNEMDKLSSQFNLLVTKNYEKGVWYKKEELVGLDENFIKSLKFDSKKNMYFVSAFLSSQYRIVKKFAVSKVAREKITKVNEQGVGDKNTERLSKILKLRMEMAKILGYKTYSDLAMETEMVDKPSEAKKFLLKLAKDLKSKTDTEKAEAKEFLKTIGEKLNTSNFSYAETNIQKTKESLDLVELSKYFEMENTFNAMFAVWEKYFDVEVVPIKKLSIFNNSQLYAFYNKTSKELLGYSIFDLHPRKGKYGHACVSPIHARYIDTKNNVHPATAALVCNFIESKDGKSLLDMESVSTLFHEGGHLIHYLLGKNNYSSTASFSNAIDFVEIPSQFLENFTNTKVAAQSVAKHYKSGAQLPKHLLSKIEKSDEYFGASMWLRQIVYSLFDLEIHGKNISLYAKNYKKLDQYINGLQKKLIKIDTLTTPKFISTFGHMTGGYASKYFGYVVSRAYAQDVWESFVKRELNKKSKSQYKTLLESAGMFEEKDILENYLGRKPSSDALVKKLGS